MSVSLLVLLPGYNVERHLAPLVSDIRQHEPGSDICVVDDGSDDETANEAERLGTIVLRHGNNRGKGEALKTGFQYGCEENYDAVVTMDADGQHLAAELPLFRQAFEAGNAVVLGSRMAKNENMPWRKASM